MTDRELLELAAKAANTAGANLTFHHGIWYDSDYDVEWNPLTDDGDALRLAVKLRIDLCINNGAAEAIWINEEISETHSLTVPCNEAFEGWGAKFAATRRAIVGAAAEIGKALP